MLEFVDKTRLSTMSLCRICLRQKPRKDITQLILDNNEAKPCYKDVFMFCLSIQISQESIPSTKLCVKCYRKILDFYKFKTLALKNNVYWQTLSSSELENKVFQDDKHYKIIKIEPDPEVSDNEINEETLFEEFGVKEDIINADAALTDLKIEVKEENLSDDDDEFLSVIKKVKDHSPKETIENASIKTKRDKPKKLQIKEVVTKSKICDECGKAVKDLKRHLIKHIPLEIRRKIKCELCDKFFSTNILKQRHIQRKHLSLKKKCHLCDKSVSNLKLHIRLIHNPESLPYQCTSCGRRFQNQGRLDSHLSVHTKDRPFECDICGNKFRIKLSLDNHKRQVHDKERTHLCQFCSKSFFKKHHLNVHLRSHTKENPYPCSECGKSFRTSTTLKNHLLIHSTDKNYNCTLCDMSFATSGYLRSHMVSHKKEKRYPCKYCEVRFHRSDHRKRHEYTAHLRPTAT